MYYGMFKDNKIIQLVQKNIRPYGFREVSEAEVIALLGYNPFLNKSENFLNEVINQI